LSRFGDDLLDLGDELLDLGGELSKLGDELLNLGDDLLKLGDELPGSEDDLSGSASDVLQRLRKIARQRANTKRDVERLSLRPVFYPAAQWLIAFQEKTTLSKMTISGIMMPFEGCKI